MPSLHAYTSDPNIFWNAYNELHLWTENLCYLKLYSNWLNKLLWLVLFTWHRTKAIDSWELSCHSTHDLKTVSSDHNDNCSGQAESWGGHCWWWQLCLHPGEERICQGKDKTNVTISNTNYQVGKFTPESACEHPDAVKQLAIEFARAGADVTQTFTYGSTEGMLEDCAYTLCSKHLLVQVYCMHPHGYIT